MVTQSLQILYNILLTGVLLTVLDAAGEGDLDYKSTKSTPRTKILHRYELKVNYKQFILPSTNGLLIPLDDFRLLINVFCSS